MPAATGTSNAPAPLAVYSMPALAAANLEPKVSPWVAGNRLKISPYTPKYSAVTSTNVVGFDPDWLSVYSAMAPAKNASAMVYSRPIWSDSQPKNGRPTPSNIRFSDNANTNAGKTKPNNSTGILSILRSLAMGAMDAAMVRPPAAINTNITYST